MSPDNPVRSTPFIVKMNILRVFFGHVSRLDESTRRHTRLCDLTLTHHLTDFQIVHGVVARGRPRGRQAVRTTSGQPLQHTWRYKLMEECYSPCSGGATRRPSPATLTMMMMMMMMSGVQNSKST